MELENGVLIGEKKKWNYQEEYAEDLEDMNTLNVINLQYSGLVYSDEDYKKRHYKGPIYRRNEDGTYTKVGEI